jgi:hypothetical protein
MIASGQAGKWITSPTDQALKLNFEFEPGSPPSD